MVFIKIIKDCLNKYQKIVYQQLIDAINFFFELHQVLISYQSLMMNSYDYHLFISKSGICAYTKAPIIKLIIFTFFIIILTSLIINNIKSGA